MAIRSPRPLCKGITDSHDQSADWSRNDTQILSASVIAKPVRTLTVGSELSAAGGRGSEVSEWPRSKFPASAVRQRRNFGHRNRIIGPYGWEHAGMSLGTNGGMDMKKCGYCGKEVKGELDFCSDGCEKSYKDENEKDERRIKYFAGGIVLGLLVIAVSAFTKSVFMVGIGIIIMGIVEFLLPFTTPETIAFLGYKRAKTAGRIAGIVLIAVGIWVGLI